MYGGPFLVCESQELWHTHRGLNDPYPHKQGTPIILHTT